MALSWAHNTADNPLLDVKDLPAAMRERGLTAGIVIGFDDVILARYPLGSMLGDVDPEHVFQVHLRHPELEKRFPFPTAGGTAPKFPLVMRFPIATGPAAVVPVTWVPDTPDGMRVADAIYADPAGSTATGLAYLFNRELRAVLRGVELWARVNGDFISDLGKRPVDVDFVRFALRKTDDALQPVRGGGVFESWFGCRPQ